MTFKLSKRSLDRLEGVDERLQSVVKSAIHMTEIDFGVICGMRTVDEQRALVKSGASQTMKSRHLEGKAVDLMAYVQTSEGSRACWELNVYDNIADAMAQAAKDAGVAICWGASWSTGTIPYPMDIRHWNGTMEDAMNAYIDKKRAMGKRAFMDGPHFELID